MLTADDMHDRVLVQIRTITQGALGPSEAWADGKTLNCLVKQVGTFSKYARDNQGQVLRYDITFRGRLSLDWDNTRFKWLSRGGTGIFLKPMDPSKIPGRLKGDRTGTVIACEDYTNSSVFPKV